jgi:hypothetical protein
MRFRLSLGLPLTYAALAAVLFVPRARAQDRSSDPINDGFMPGSYLRLSAGVTAPVNAQGNLRNWSRGQSANLMWETWGAGSGGTDLTGFGLGIGYTMLPLDDAAFVRNFTPTLVTGQTATATASKAGVFEVATSIRIRIPAPYIMPHISLGFGFMNWHPGTIHYTTTTGESADARQQSRSGAEFTIGGGLDKQVYDRYGVFAEAIYAYGFTNLGQGLATPTGTCSSNGCDALKNTSLGTIRGGLRVRLGE